MKVVDKRREPFTRYIGRGSAFGNPFTHLPLAATKALVQCTDVDQAVKFFEEWANGGVTWDKQIPARHRAALWDAIDSLCEADVLGCYCPPGAPCHGRVITALWKASWRRRKPAPTKG